jgi:fucose permease
MLYNTGSWISRIPDIKDNLNLSNTQLSLMLLCVAVGAITSLPLSSRLVECVGSAVSVVVGITTLCVTIPFLGSTSVVFVIGGMFLMGECVCV